jgi:aromatase
MNEHTTVHSRVVSAPADVAYDLVADVSRWPVIFEPSVHVQHLERGARSERFRLWASVNREVKTWTSRRELDPGQLRIGFRQERTQPPFAAMGGEWVFRPVSKGRTEVTLTHRFSAVDDDALASLSAAVDHNSEKELAALGRFAQFEHPVADLVCSFSDTVRLSGSAADAYRFVDRSDEWPQRLPHVRRVELRRQPAAAADLEALDAGMPEFEIQDMEMDTVTGDGSAHTTRSIRLCFPARHIVYKQLVPPALLFGHSGTWTFTEGPDGAVATATHTVAINPAAVREVLGSGSTVADARAYLRAALGANSRATLLHAGAVTAELAAEGTSP